MNPNKMTKLGDLGAARRSRAVLREKERLAAEAAGREARGETLPLYFEDPEEPFAVLPAELPVAAIAPLRNLNLDITLVIRQVLDLARLNADDPDEVAARMGVADMAINLLVQNPNLPAELLGTVEEIAVALFGTEGYARFLAEKESLDDVAATAMAVAKWYAAALGKLMRRWSSSDDGPTSKQTSSDTTTPTPESSGPTPELPAGSESADS